MIECELLSLENNTMRHSLNKYSHFECTINAKAFIVQRYFISYNKLFLIQIIMGNHNKGLDDTQFSIHKIHTRDT